MGFFDKIVNNVQSFANDVQKNVEKTWNDATEQVTRVTSDVIGKGPIEAAKINIVEPVVKTVQPVVEKAADPIVNNEVVDFVKKNNVISMVTNPDDSVVVQGVKDVWENNEVVDFVKKNNVISMVTNPDDSVVVKTVTEGIDGISKGAEDAWNGFTKGAEDVFNNIGSGLSKAWPYIAIGGGALLVLSILK